MISILEPRMESDAVRWVLQISAHRRSRRNMARSSGYELGTDPKRNCGPGRMVGCRQSRVISIGILMRLVRSVQRLLKRMLASDDQSRVR